LRQGCEPFVDLRSQSLGVGELRAKRIVVLAEPAEARLLRFEVSMRRCKLAAQRTLHLPLLDEALTEFTVVLQSGGEFVAIVKGFRQ
jgi:hypothetical protein